MNWEVFIPGHEPGALNKTVTVEAENWLEALTAGLDQLGQRGPDLRNLMLDIKDSAVHVTDLQRARVFEVRPLEGPEPEGSEADEQGLDDDAPTGRMKAAPRGSKPPSARDSEVPPPRPSPHGPRPRRKQGLRVAPDPVPTPLGPEPQPVEPAAPEPQPERAPEPQGPAVRGRPEPAEPAPELAAPAREEATPALPPRPAAPPREASPAAPRPEPPAEAALPRHVVFFTHDEDPGDGNRLTYRERLISVPPETAHAAAELLLRAVYERIKAEIGSAGPGKYINLAVFDHEFRERAERPALAALNWKDWRGPEPEVTFPLAAPAVVETSYIPAAEEERRRPTGRRRIPSAEMHIGRAPESPDLDDVLAEVFEAMQEVYALGSLERCIDFGVELAAAKIPCQAAAGLAMAPGQETMVCVATRGQGAERLVGTRVPLRGSLVGFAVQQGVAVAISDAPNDPRVSADLDTLVGPDTRSVLCMPMVFEGRTFGLLELVNRRTGDSWQPVEINVLSYIASQLGEYIAESLASEVDDFSDLDELSSPGISAPPPAPQPAKAAPASARKPAAAPSKKKKRKKK